MTLAASPDVEAVLERSLTSTESTRVDSLLTIASSAVIEYTRRRFEPGDYTITRSVPTTGKLTLPAAVASVSEVRQLDELTGLATVLAGWTLRNNTLYGLRLLCPEASFADRRYPTKVEVDFTVTDAVPDDVRELTAGIVAATLLSPQVGVQSETVGPFATSYADSSGRVWLSKSDKLVLNKYRMPKPTLGI